MYIPYSKLRALFEKEGRGVFLPYDQFRALWEAAQAKAREVPEIKPPLRSLITEIDSQATISEEVMTVSALLKVDLLDEGWHEIPLRLNNAAIRSVAVEGENGRLVFDPNRGYGLLLENPNKEPLSVAVELAVRQSLSAVSGQELR